MYMPQETILFHAIQIHSLVLAIIFFRKDQNSAEFSAILIKNPHCGNSAAAGNTEYTVFSLFQALEQLASLFPVDCLFVKVKCLHESY